MKEPKHKGDWVTNAGKNAIRAHYPRRLAKYVEGEPRKTGLDDDLIDYTVLVGLYLAEDIPEGIKSRPMVTYGDKPIHPKINN